MTTFTSNNEAKKVAEQIAKTIQVFFTNEGLEILFFETLKSMNLDNKLILQRIEDNGIINNISLNADGLHTTASPCP